MFKITEKNYKRIITFFSERNFAFNALKFCYRFLPLLLFIGYPVLIVYVFFSNPVDLFRIILVPLGVFLLVTVLRKVINEQRPYEKYSTPSLFGKTTKRDPRFLPFSLFLFVKCALCLKINFYSCCIFSVGNNLSGPFINGILKP